MPRLFGIELSGRRRQYDRMSAADKAREWRRNPNAMFTLESDYGSARTANRKYAAYMKARYAGVGARRASPVNRSGTRGYLGG